MGTQTFSPTVVLVHGAWADGSSWSRVITGLHQTGIPVVAAPIPLTTLDDDVNALDRTIDRTAPDEGETVADVFYRDPPHRDAPELKPDDQGWIWLPVKAFAKAFAQHGTAEQHAVLAAVQRPIAVPCIQQPVPKPGWEDRPSWCLVAEEDRMINPITQKFMAQRMHANVHTHDADHAPLITRPQAVVDIISEAVRSDLS